MQFFCIYVCINEILQHPIFISLLEKCRSNDTTFQMCVLGKKLYYQRNVWKLVKNWKKKSHYVIAPIFSLPHKLTVQQTHKIIRIFNINYSPFMEQTFFIGDIIIKKEKTCILSHIQYYIQTVIIFTVCNYAQLFWPLRASKDESLVVYSLCKYWSCVLLLLLALRLLCLPFVGLQHCLFGSSKMK